MPIALLTDFGTRDYFVGAMKGVILSIDPDAVIVDITHEIAPQNIREGAYTLHECYRDFPPGTIFVAIVDPGVGSARRAMVVEADRYYFIAPDNGLLSFVLDGAARPFEITRPEFMAPNISSTFHGRDIFAPAAAHVSRGVSPGNFGPEISDPVILTGIRPVRVSDTEIEAEFIHTDRFGNLVTNLAEEDLPEKFTIQIGATLVRAHRAFYAEAEPGEIFSIIGSAGFLELSVRDGSAAAILNLPLGQKIKVISETF